MYFIHTSLFFAATPLIQKLMTVMISHHETLFPPSKDVLPTSPLNKVDNQKNTPRNFVGWESAEVRGAECSISPHRAEDDWLNVSSSSSYCSVLSCLVQVETQLLFKEILKSEQKNRVFSDASLTLSLFPPVRWWIHLCLSLQKRRRTMTVPLQAKEATAPKTGLHPHPQTPGMEVPANGLRPCPPSTAPSPGCQPRPRPSIAGVASRKARRTKAGPCLRTFLRSWTSGDQGLCLGGLQSRPKRAKRR